MLVVRHRLSGGLNLPGGMARTGEGAQCTAHRETWEETGLDVLVHGLRYRFANGFALYDCRLPDGSGTAEQIPVPASGTAEVAGVLWVDPRDTAPSHWRFPDQYPDLVRLIEDAGHPGPRRRTPP